MRPPSCSSRPAIPSSFLKPADSASLPAPGLTAGGFVSTRACQHISFSRQELGLGRPIIPHLESFSSAQRTSHGRFFILCQATQAAVMPLDELSGRGRAGVSVSVCPRAPGCSPVHCQLPSHFGAEDARPRAEAEPDASAGRSVSALASLGLGVPSTHGDHGDHISGAESGVTGPRCQRPSGAVTVSQPWQACSSRQAHEAGGRHAANQPIIQRREVRLRNTEGCVPSWDSHAGF